MIAGRIDPGCLAVDLLRSCYRTKMRLYRDSDQLTDVQWFFVPANRPWIDVPSSFGSAIWTRGDFTESPGYASGPGEVLGETRPWVNGRPPAGLVCTFRRTGSAADWSAGGPPPPLRGGAGFGGRLIPVPRVRLGGGIGFGGQLVDPRRRAFAGGIGFGGGMLARTLPAGGVGFGGDLSPCASGVVSPGGVVPEASRDWGPDEANGQQLEPYRWFRLKPGPIGEFEVWTCGGPLIVTGNPFYEFDPDTGSLVNVPFTMRQLHVDPDRYCFDIDADEPILNAHQLYSPPAKIAWFWRRTICDAPVPKLISVGGIGFGGTLTIYQTGKEF